ncbi:hypothetical protein Cni_G23707 [Canna indica]|uniref:Uncharacterized protein n=1 Tax=Canna indica TaxID=4628 RepID=A0AAQ3QMR8_9LILI|nr:hypothetical protein Cni_G23707 [Canna indica]
MKGAKPSPSIAELEAVSPLAEPPSSPPRGHFNGVLPPISSTSSKEALPDDLCWMMNTLKNESSQILNAPTADADVKSQGSETRRHIAKHKERKPIYLTESPYFGSYVHYGARDFYRPPSLSTSESFKHVSHCALRNCNAQNKLCDTSRHRFCVYSIRMMKGTIWETRISPLEVNGGKVHSTIEGASLNYQ